MPRKYRQNGVRKVIFIMRPLDDSGDSYFRETETGIELANSYMKVDATLAAGKNSGEELHAWTWDEIKSTRRTQSPAYLPAA
jgi:hypothetical protein